MGIPYEHDDNIDLRDLEEVELNNLNISGTLGVGTASNVGTAGALLTSNGSGAAVSWKEPVYYSAHLTSDITYSNIYAVPQNVTGLTVDTISHPTSFDAATGIFTAPRDGIYYVDYGVFVTDHISPEDVKILVSRIDFRANSSDTFTQHTGNIIITAASQPSHVQSNVSSIIQLNTGSQIRCVFQMIYDTNNNLGHGATLLSKFEHPTAERESLRATRQSVFAIF